MAQIKVRVVVNKGRTGAPLEKLSDIARQFDRFMRSLVGDLALQVRKGEILALNFGNSSVAFDAAFQVEVADSKVREFNRYIEFVADYDPETEGTNAIVSDNTLLEYARIGQCIDPDEEVGIGIYAPGSKGRVPKRWRQINYRKMSRVRQAIEQPIMSYGSVQGLMHSLIKEATQPYFQVREASTDHLVRCLYQDELYPEVVNALRERNAVVHASGFLQLDRAKRVVDEIRVERIDKIEPLSDEEFRSLFGTAPNLTGDLTTEEFVRAIRDEDA
jgi:hypothetical protein